jgi:heat shock protein HslJ
MKKIFFAGMTLCLFFLWACATESALVPPGGLSLDSQDGANTGAQDGAHTDTEDGASRKEAEDAWSLEEARKAVSGMYKGLMPYPGSDGLETVIRLRKDGSYILRSRVKGKADDTFEMSGNFDIDRNGLVSLDKEAVNTISRFYSFDPGQAALIQLDKNVRPISGDAAGRYLLKRFPAEITETYWKLVRLYGKPVVWTGEKKRQPHIILRIEGHKTFGHSGTNNFSGTYKVSDNGGIKFSPMRSTMIASPNMKIEMELYRALNEADSFTVSEESFALGVKGQPPSAEFEAVYLY